MKRIDSINARPNANGAGKTGFHDNADLSGQDATYLTPEWLNVLQEELCNLLEMNGIALNSGVRDQLYQLLATDAEINALAAATQVKLDQEQTWRTDADNWLQQQINNEQTARINAINQEQAWRENADADLENRKFDKAGGTVAGDVTINGILTVLANIAALTLKSNVGGTEIETLFGKLTLTNIPNGGGISQVFNTTADLYQFDKPIFAPNIGNRTSWIAVTSSRQLNTTYSNPYDRDLHVLISIQDNQGNSPLTINVQGTVILNISDFGAGGTHPIFFTVPAFQFYSVDSPANGVNTIRCWSERS